MYNQVLQAPTPIIQVCVDVRPTLGQSDEPMGIMRGQYLGMCILMCVGRTISMRAHPKDEAYAFELC
jgi:hypothetical protein